MDMLRRLISRRIIIIIIINKSQRCRAVWLSVCCMHDLRLRIFRPSPCDWNTLPSSVTTYETLGTFKRHYVWDTRHLPASLRMRHSAPLSVVWKCFFLSRHHLNCVLRILFCCFICCMHVMTSKDCVLQPSVKPLIGLSWLVWYAATRLLLLAST